MVKNLNMLIKDLILEFRNWKMLLWCWSFWREMRGFELLILVIFFNFWVLKLGFLLICLNFLLDKIFIKVISCNLLDKLEFKLLIFLLVVFRCLLVYLVKVFFWIIFYCVLFVRFCLVIGIFLFLFLLYKCDLLLVMVLFYILLLCLSEY